MTMKALRVGVNPKQFSTSTMCTQALKMTKALSQNIGRVFSKTEAGTKEPLLLSISLSLLKLDFSFTSLRGEHGYCA